MSRRRQEPRKGPRYVWLNEGAAQDFDRVLAAVRKRLERNGLDAEGYDHGRLVARAFALLAEEDAAAEREG